MFKAIIKSILFQQYKYQLLLIVVIVACIWPISLHVFIPKWDNINAYLPYRYFISDFLWNGHLPLWNPFQRLGYPGYSDLQSGCWNPITWFIMLFGKYTISSLVTEFVLCFIIAGLGMYQLCNYLYNNDKTSFLIALSYALSGVMVGSSELMVFLIGVAWLPWCVFALLKFLQTLDYKYILLLSIFVACNTAGASPAYTIILAYIVLIIILYFIWKNYKNIKRVKKILLGGILLSVLSTLLLLPFLNSFLEFSPYFNRIDKLPFKGFLLSNPFTPREYLSFVLPYPVISFSEIFNNTDLSLRNGYFGLTGFVFFIIAIFGVKNKYTFPLLITIFISLILAAGNSTFIYKFVYHLPGFGVFRHPSFFRTYTIFACLLFSGFAIKESIKTGYFSKKEKIALIITSIVFFGVSVISFFYTSISESIAAIKNLINYQEFSTSSFATHLFLNATLILILGFAVFIAKKLLKLSLFTSLFLFILFDLGMQTQLTSPTTMCYKFTYSSMAKYFNELPNNINQNDNSTPLKLLNEKQGLKFTDGIWQNMSTFNKTLSCVGVNPLRFKSWDKAKKNGVLERNLENEIIYFPTKYYHKGDSLQKGFIWGVNTPNTMNKNTKSIVNINIGYNKFTAVVKNSSKQKQWLILNQNYHHLWKAYFNGKSLPINKVNELVMGVEIPQNSEGEIQFRFESPNTVYTFIISLIAYILLTIYLFKIFVVNKN